MEDLKRIVEKYIANKEFDKAIDMLSSKINEDDRQLHILEMRGDLYYTLQRFGDALNDFNKILKFDKNNRTILSKAEMTKQILKFQNIDIYESTNLNLDPWLDE